MNTLNNDDDDQVFAMTPYMVVWVAYTTAFGPEDEGPEPRRRAKSVVDAGRKLAEKRGFRDAARLERLFTKGDRLDLSFPILERLFGVVSPEELLSADGETFAALFHSKH